VKLVLNSDALIKTPQVGAAAEKDMLAVVDDLVDAWMKIGAGASAEIASPLDQAHAESTLCQSAGSTHAGHPAADDGDCLLPGLLNWAQLSFFPH